MAYFNYFCENVLNNHTETIKGVCKEMCPQEEIEMRVKARLVHILEVVGPEKILVKSYSRSAADTAMAVPRLLRPYDVLIDTIQYLLLNVIKRKDVSERAIYNFVDDRFRAVRQDMTIQRLSADECTRLLEPMIRFYIYYGYKLCELSVQEFDPILNKKYLLECLKWFLSSCDRCYKETNISDIFDNMDLNDKYKLTCDRVLMESLYILCNLDDIHPLYRYLDLPKNLRRAPALHLAYKIGAANLKGNYVTVCRLSRQLCPLAQCALCTYLPTLQRVALRVMSVAYSSATQAVPCEALRRWTRGETNIARHYGLHVTDDGYVRFRKTDFRNDRNTLQPKRQQQEEDSEITTEYIFTYTTDDKP